MSSKADNGWLGGALPARRIVLLSLTALGIVAAAGACGSGDSGGGWSAGGDGQVQVEMLWAGGQLSLLGVRDVDEDIPPTPQPAADEPSVAWQFVGSDGVLQASGSIVEPWHAHTDFDETGAADPREGIAPAVVLRLVVPDMGGTVRLLKPSAGSPAPQPQGDGDDELASLPIPGSGQGGGANQGCNGGTQPPANTSGGAQPSGSVAGLTKIIDKGGCAGNVNILILSEGYKQSEMGKFRSDAQAMASSLLAIGGFKEFKDRFNVWTLEVPSTDSGVTDKANNLKKNTAFNTAFGDNNPTPRRCVIPQAGVSSQVQAKRAAAEQASNANIVAMLLNINEHAGCAIPSERLVTVAANNLAPSVFAHELGHSLYKLRDEYTVGTCNLKSAGGGPNTTKDPKNPPWKALVNTAQLPTTGGTGTTVGAYEGAEYCTAGVYRPQQNCLMRNLNVPFCKVCAGVASQYFAARAEKKPKNAAEACPVDAGAEGEASAAPPPNCFQGGPACPSGQVCSWNGNEASYCCKAPFTGSQTCFSDEECGSGGICGFGGPPENFFWCVTPDSPPCIPQ
jgi:hypothetical protein